MNTRDTWVNVMDCVYHDRISVANFLLLSYVRDDGKTIEVNFLPDCQFHASKVSLYANELLSHFRHLGVFRQVSVRVVDSVPGDCLHTKDIWNFPQTPKTDNYSTYLKTPEWKARRKKRLEIDGHRCRVCNSPDNLDVHHRTYERLGCERSDDLTTLCRSCHEMYHGGAG